MSRSPIAIPSGSDFPPLSGRKKFFEKNKKSVDKEGVPWYTSYCSERTKQVQNELTWGISSAGRALDWQSRGQRFDPAILHQEKPWNHMVSRFFLIYGKLHKVAFVLNLCWTRGKIAHNPPFLATHFCNFFYIFIISTFYTNALIGKGFFCPFEKAQSKKCIFLSTLSFLLLCWISCWITNSSPLFSRTGTLVVPVPLFPYLKQYRPAAFLWEEQRQVSRPFHLIGANSAFKSRQ